MVARLPRTAPHIIGPDARTIDVEGHLYTGALGTRFADLGRSDRKGLALNLQRHVARIPAIAGQEQVLGVGETQQRRRLELAGLRALAEEDRVMRQQPRIFARDDADQANVIAELGRRFGDYAHVPVEFTVHNHPICHVRPARLQR